MKTSFLRLNVSLKIAFFSEISTESGHLNEIKGMYKICMKMYFKKHLYCDVVNYNKSVEDVFQINLFLNIESHYMRYQIQ